MYKQRLEEYIEKDKIYQAYKKQKEIETSDFDNFCILHCEDIEEALFDLEQLKKENNQLKEQYCERTDCGGRLGNSKKVERLIQENKELHNKIDKLEDELNWYKQECDDLEMSGDVDE